MGGESRSGDGHHVCPTWRLHVLFLRLFSVSGCLLATPSTRTEPCSALSLSSRRRDIVGRAGEMRQNLPHGVTGSTVPDGDGDAVTTADADQAAPQKKKKVHVKRQLQVHSGDLAFQREHSAINKCQGPNECSEPPAGRPPPRNHEEKMKPWMQNTKINSRSH